MSDVGIPFTSDHATFIGFAVEAIAYGANVVLFFTAISILTYRARHIQTKTPIFIVTCLLFALCTVHFSLNFNNVYNGLMVHPRKISEETNLLQGADMIFYLADFIAELVLIYRCWLIWEKNYLVTVLPVLASLAALGCGCGSIALLNEVNPTSHQAPVEIVPLGTAGFALALAVNFIVTGLIIGRIWYASISMNRIVAGSGDTFTFSRPISIMIESGLPVLVAQFVLVVLFAMRHPAQAILVPFATQIYGIAPTLIIVRSGAGSICESSVSQKSTMRFTSFRGGKSSKGSTNTYIGDSIRDGYRSSSQLDEDEP